MIFYFYQQMNKLTNRQSNPSFLLPFFTFIFSKASKINNAKIACLLSQNSVKFIVQRAALNSKSALFFKKIQHNFFALFIFSSLLSLFFTACNNSSLRLTETPTQRVERIAQKMRDEREERNERLAEKYKRQHPNEKYAEMEDETDGIREAIAQEIELTKDVKTGQVPRERLLTAYKYADSLRKTPSNKRVLGAIGGILWEERGPNNVGGRTRAVMYDLNDATGKTVWAGGVGGGLWKTTDITASTVQWTASNDFFSNLAITAIAQDPRPGFRNTLYFGTGEGWGNADAIRGAGIWKSTDSGATWTQMPTTTTSTFYYINRLLVDNSGILYAGTTSGLQRFNGTAWTKVLGNAVSGGLDDGISDLEMGANGTIFCSNGRGSSRGSVYKSTTGLVGSWTNMTLPAPDYGRIEIATAPSNADVLYAVCSNTNHQGAKGIYKCSNATAASPTWTTVTAPQICDQGSLVGFTRDGTSSQIWYDLTATCSPTNDNTLVIGGIDNLKTTDGGTTWTQISSWVGSTSCTGISLSSKYIHSDQHSIIFNPLNANQCLFACDGGLSLSNDMDLATPSFTTKNSGYNITQFYACAMHPASGSNYYLAGAQDNGTQKFTTAAVNSTTSASGGDGAFCHIAQSGVNAGNVQTTSYVYNNYYRSTNGGASFSSVAGVNHNRGSFINPSDYDDANDIIYACDDAGNYYRWNAVSSSATVQKVAVAAFGTGKITHVAVSPYTANRVFFGLSNGAVYMVDNAHTGTTATGTLIATPNANRSVSCIAFGASDDVLLVTYSNYTTISAYKITNATTAAVTTNIEGNLPDMPVRWAMFAPGSGDTQALLATELGIWTTDNINGASTTWGAGSTGLANVRVNMLQYRPSDGQIVAATHGRGLFTTMKYAPFNKMTFETSTQTVYETDCTLGASCRKYKDITLPVSLTKPVSSGDAIITFMANTGSTAVAGRDYDILTPTFTFVQNSGIKQNAVVRIYDNDVVDGTRTLTLDINEASSDITATTIGTHTITIRNDDVAPETAVASNNTVTVFSENFDNIITGTIGTWTQTTSASPVNVWTVGTSGGTGFTNKSMYISKGAGAFSYTKTAFCTDVLFSPAIDATNYANLSLSVKYKSNGELFSSVYYDFGKIGYSLDGGATYTLLTNPLQGVTTATAFVLALPVAVNNASNLKLVFYWENDDLAGGDPPFGIDDLVLSGTATTYTPAPIQTAVNASIGENYLGPNQTVNFYDDVTGAVMATIQNNSTHDFGCTKVEIDRTGTSATSFWNNTAANKVIDKTFKITPTTNNTSANYTVNFFYTKPEIDGWIATTGNTISDFKLVKIANHSVSDVTVSTPYIADVQEGTATSYTTFNDTHYKFSCSFSGFSGFGGGKIGAALPVTLVSFTGKYANNAVVLNWETKGELNNSGFEVQTVAAADLGKENAWQTIGFVSGNGTTTAPHSYAFTDYIKRYGVQYYRLKQIDYDKKFEYSNSVSIKMPESEYVSISPNPVRSSTTIRFAQALATETTLELFDASGKLVQTETVAPNGQLQINFQLVDNLPIGLYILKVNTNNTAYSLRLVKE